MQVLFFSVGLRAPWRVQPPLQEDRGVGNVRQDKSQARTRRFPLKKYREKTFFFAENRYFEDVSSSGGSVCPLSEAAAIGYDNLVVRPFANFLILSPIIRDLRNLGKLKFLF